jgi:hypothetical protein
MNLIASREALAAGTSSADYVSSAADAVATNRGYGRFSSTTTRVSRGGDAMTTDYRWVPEGKLPVHLQRIYSKPANLGGSTSQRAND